MIVSMGGKKNFIKPYMLATLEYYVYVPHTEMGCYRLYDATNCYISHQVMVAGNK